MKPERVELDGVRDLSALVRRVLQTRLREARRLAAGLKSGERQELHDFRIACKRLRYALERFESVDASLGPTAERLALLQDALGEMHDRDALLAILPAAMAETERRLRSGRKECVKRATELWREAEKLARACTLISFE